MGGETLIGGSPEQNLLHGFRPTILFHLRSTDSDLNDSPQGNQKYVPW
jgi:hypothetical protein